MLDQYKDGALVETLQLSASKRVYKVGRQAGFADVVLAHASISREHATLTVSASGSVVVCDLGSAHGTSISGKRLPANKPHLLAPGRTHCIGGEVELLGRIRYNDGLDQYRLTVGELATMIKGEAWINQAAQLNLTVIPVTGYNKALDYELPVAPSPNLPNSTAIRLYPSLCLFEATVVSVGRGTAWPFQVIGHNEVTLGDFTFTPQSMPESAPNPKLKGELLFGRDLRDSVIEGFNIELLYAVYQQFEEREQTFIDRPDFFDLLSGTDKLRKQLSEGLDPAAIRATWQPGLNAFKAQRQPYLLYPQ